MLLVAAIVGAVAGAYTGGVIANDSYNPAKWDYQSGGTWAYMIGGAAIGTISSVASAGVGLAVNGVLHVGGFLGGSIVGGAAGAIGGAINGFGLTALGGGTFSESLRCAGFSAMIGLGAGVLFGGTMQGISALRNGRTFWTGELKPVVSNDIAQGLSSIKAPQVEMNTDGMRTKLLDMPEFLDKQSSLVEIKGIDGQSRWITQQDLTLSPRQALHLGNVGTKSPLTIDPNILLNDLNNGNFQFVQLNSRGMPIIRFDYTIGDVIQQGTGVNIGSTNCGTVHINNSGQVHIVPWLFK